MGSFAALAIAQGSPDVAIRLVAAAATLRDEANLPETPSSRTERLLAAAGLSEMATRELWTAGSKLSSDAAVDLALTVPDMLATRKPELTVRELEIAALITRGLSNRVIADELGISSATVARHIANIMAKLGFTSRLQIAAWVTEHDH